MKETRSVAAPGFRALLLTQSLSAFNDNAFKTVAALLMVATLPPGRSAQFIAAAGAVFILPFLLLSTAAGSVADRFSKKKIIVVCKCIELALMLLSLLALPQGNIPFLLAILFCLGAHSAFIGPAKMAILPELLDDADLSRGNGLMQMMTFLGIVLDPERNKANATIISRDGARPAVMVVPTNEELMIARETAHILMS